MMIDESIGDGVAEEESGMYDCEDFSDGDADKKLRIDLVRAAMVGNEEFLEQPNLKDEHCFRISREENNILHIAIRYNQIKFAIAFLKTYFRINTKLITEKNNSLEKNTPLHIAAEVGNLGITRMLLDYFLILRLRGHEDKPLRARNKMGNTALHVAVLNDNFSVAIQLLFEDASLALMFNNSKETPLHLAVTHMNPRDSERMTEQLLEKARCVASRLDANGFTPLHRAALSSSVNPSAIRKLIDVCPESTLVCDASGKSFLHLLIHRLSDVHQYKLNLRHETVENLICRKEISALIDHPDQDGNTPLHIALKYKNICVVRSLLFKCSANCEKANRGGISARSMIHDLDWWHQLHRPRTMTEEEFGFASEGNIDSLLKERPAIEFYGSQYSKGSKPSNFLHLLMNKPIEHHDLSSSDGHSKFLDFIKSALCFFPQLICQTDQTENTPLHILAQNKDFCKTLADPTLGNPSLLSKLLSICVNAITTIEAKNEAENLVLPWVKKNADGNAPIHEAIIANNKVLVRELLSYSEESARLVNKHEETPLHLLAKTDRSAEEFTVKEMVKANPKALGLQDKDGLNPISRAIKAENLNVVVTLLHNNQGFCDTNGPTLWHLFLKNKFNNFLGVLLKDGTFKEMLKQKDEDGKTPLHIAIQEQYFCFVENLLQAGTSEHESLPDDQWLMDLLSIPNNAGETPEDLLADLPTLPPKLEEKLLTDHRLLGIRSSWGVPRTKLQNYAKSISVIAAVGVAATFAVLFAVPGGLDQDKGTPILIQTKAFQVHMMSNVTALCLSFVVLILVLWTAATKKRDSIMILDISLILLLASVVPYAGAIIWGVFATTFTVKPWIAIYTLVLCCLLVVFIYRSVVTRVLLPINYNTVKFVRMLLDPAAGFSKITEKWRRRHRHVGRSGSFGV